MSFAHPEYLYLLIFIPIFFILFVVRLRANDRLLHSYIQGSCLKVATGFISRKRQIERYFILLIMFVFLILALARPQSEKEQESVEIKGSEVIILADVSKSMLVEDMNGLSRLSVMKKELARLIKLFSGQRVGLISFSGAATLISPLTLDHSVLILFLESLSTQSHIMQGTDFGGAFRAAWQAMKRGSALPLLSSSSRVIVVASDGEDNEQQALNTAKELADQKVRIFTLGFGTKKGGMIPMYDNRGQKTAYKKDRQGNPVVSRFNEATLKKIARITGGAFYPFSLGGHTIEKVYSDIQEIGEDTVSYQSQNIYKEWYQYFTIIAFCLGALYFLIGEKKKNQLQIWHSYLEKK